MNRQTQIPAPVRIPDEKNSLPLSFTSPCPPALNYCHPEMKSVPTASRRRGHAESSKASGEQKSSDETHTAASGSLGHDVSFKRQKPSASAASPSLIRDLSLRQLIPPKGCPRLERMMQTTGVKQIDLKHYARQSNGSDQKQSSSPVLQDWSAVIARVRSHPHEAAVSYFVKPDAADETTSEMHDARMNCEMLAYKPLHAMLKYDPPFEAVEAVLRAHPEAAPDVTFAGSALKIAVESGAGLKLLRLLFVAEMAMQRKALLQGQRNLGDLRTAAAAEYDADDESESSGTCPQEQKRGKAKSEGDLSSDRSERKTMGDQHEAQGQDHESSVDTADLLLPSQDVFEGHNPIRWITEHRVPVDTAAVLLKWYPVGAFKRHCPDEKGAPGHDDVESSSPLIDIVNDFARDHYAVVNEEGRDGAGDEEDANANDDDGAASNVEQREPGSEQDQAATHRQQERLRKEQRWEKLLHILRATDQTLRSARGPRPPPDEGDPATPGGAAPSGGDGSRKPGPGTAGAGPDPPFRPVHAWVCCLTAPRLGLGRCRPRGARSVLRAMAQQIPSEFAERDADDGDRTAFQTLAERPAGDCRLRPEEVKDVVECLMDADHRSAFLPRKSDGRLIGHVALENGWPCKDLFLRKTHATCA